MSNSSYNYNKFYKLADLLQSIFKATKYDAAIHSARVAK